MLDCIMHNERFVNKMGSNSHGDFRVRIERGKLMFIC